jgi:hypothetical protein
MFLRGFKMTGEFRKPIELLGFDEQTKKKIIDLFKSFTICLWEVLRFFTVNIKAADVLELLSG